MKLNIRNIAQALGGTVVGRDAVNCPGPGHSRTDRSLTIKLVADCPDGFIVHSHAGDDWQTCRDFVRSKLGLPEWKAGAWDEAAIRIEVSRRPAPTEDDAIRIKRAVSIWNEAGNPQGTIVEGYLASRKLELTPAIAGAVLRFHPRCPMRNENTGHTDYVPAMIAAFRSIDNNAITGIHRIRLDQPERWPKARRLMLGIVGRAAVKLDSVAGHSLYIGEGIETCMAGQQLGFKPAWALGSVGGISFFPLIDGINRLAIFAETGEASETAIKLCGRRWHDAKRVVQIIRPDVGSSDLNDELIARCK